MSPQHFFTAYADFYRPFIATVNRILAPYQLYSAQWSVLKRLGQSELHTIAGLAKLHCVEPPTMTDTLKKLLKLGYIKIERGDDGREKKVQITRKGQMVHDQLTPLFDALWEKLVSDINLQELETCVGLLQTFREKLSNFD